MVPRRDHDVSIVNVPALQAFIFSEKYLVDDSYASEMTMQNDGENVVFLDGVQQDRLHVTPALKSAFPRIDGAFADADERPKILMVDFAFYVLQGNDFQNGFVAVPINQQSNDLRASNLTLLPGNDRKLYRGTNVVPRDGIFIGDARFLPRSVTIIKSMTPGQYQFKMMIGGQRKVIGFEAGEAANVFRDKITPLLIANDPDYLAKDAIYQDLCSSYFVAFPSEATTEALQFVTPKERRVFPSGKAALELQKEERANERTMIAELEKIGLRKCKTCTTLLLIKLFEANRTECKQCRQNSRTERAHDVAVDDSSNVPKPTACVSCGKGPDEVNFKRRTDVLQGAWRKECTSCYNAKGYSCKSREKSRAKDKEGYLERNAKMQIRWNLGNPEKVKQQQRLTATVPGRKIKTIVTSAKKRGVDVNIDDISEMQNKLTLECEYCGFFPNEKESLNGLDRVDSELGYSANNTVPCCATCNAMKGPLDIDVFISNVRRISSYRNLVVTTDAQPRERLAPFSGRAELREAPKKKKIVFLSNEEKVALWSSPCYLCGFSTSFGIDRVDAGGNYSLDNSKPCCTDCNYMKKDLSLFDFETHITFVCQRTNIWTLRDVTDKPFKVFGGRTRDPVAVWDGAKNIIFPSIITASRMIGVSHMAIINAIRDCNNCKGHKWTKSSAREYRRQMLDVDIGHCVRIFFLNL